jgi:hypothetical protein
MSSPDAMLETETRPHDLPQMQNPDGRDQGPPLPQAAKMALPEMRRHPDAEAKEVLRNRPAAAHHSSKRVACCRVAVQRKNAKTAHMSGFAFQVTDSQGHMFENRSRERFWHFYRILLRLLFLHFRTITQCLISNSGNGPWGSWSHF